MTYRQLLHKLKIMSRDEPERLDTPVVVADDHDQECYLVDDLYDVWDDNECIDDSRLMLIYNVDDKDTGEYNG
jgi:hypothetical protein